MFFGFLKCSTLEETLPGGCPQSPTIEGSESGGFSEVCSANERFFYGIAVKNPFGGVRV